MSLQPPFLPFYTFNSSVLGSSLLRHFFHACWSKGITSLYIPPSTIKGGVLYQNKEDIENVYVEIIMSADKQAFFYWMVQKIPPSSLHALLLSLVFLRCFCFHSNRITKIGSTCFELCQWHCRAYIHWRYISLPNNESITDIGMRKPGHFHPREHGWVLM